MELWHDVTGYEGLYAVSLLGRVRRYASEVWVRRTDHAPHWKRYPERIIRPLVVGRGYLATQLFRDDNCLRVYVHRLVYETFVGPIPAGKEIDHIDGDRTNNHLSNLRTATRFANVHNPATFVRLGRGDSHYASLLSDKDAIAAYRAVINGERISVVAKRLGVKRQVIGTITRGITRRHLGLQPVIHDTHGRPK